MDAMPAFDKVLSGRWVWSSQVSEGSAFTGEEGDDLEHCVQANNTPSVPTRNAVAQRLRRMPWVAFQNINPTPMA